MSRLPQGGLTERDIPLASESPADRSNDPIFGFIAMCGPGFPVL